MFQQQLLKLVNRLIEMTASELDLLKQMDLQAAAKLTDEKDPLVRLYQECVIKINNDPQTREKLKAWPYFPELKKRVDELDSLVSEYEVWIKRIERSQRNFAEKLQEKMSQFMQPVKSYNKRGYMNSRQSHYKRQGGGLIATLDQSF